MTIREAVEYYEEIMNKQRRIKELERKIKIFVASKDPFKAYEIPEEDISTIIDYLEAYYSRLNDDLNQEFQQG